jgi:hypothetical protein
MAVRKEILSSLVLFLFGVLFLLYDIKYPLDELANPGPGVFPLLVGAALVILAGWQLLWSIQKKNSQAGENKNKAETRSFADTLRDSGEAKVVFMIAVFVIYLFLVKWVGFFVSNFFFVIVSSRLLGAKDRMSPIFLSVGVSLFCYFLFEVWLKISFPKGILF